jgi:hypothetical protein
MKEQNLMKILPTLFYVAAIVACSEKPAPLTRGQAQQESIATPTATSAQASLQNPGSLAFFGTPAAWSSRSTQAQIATPQPPHQQQERSTLTWNRLDGRTTPAGRPGDNVDLRQGDKEDRAQEAKQPQERVITVPNALTRIQAELYQHERIVARIKRIEARGAFKTLESNAKPAHYLGDRPGDTVDLRPGDKVVSRPESPRRPRERVNAISHSASGQNQISLSASSPD